MSGEASKPQRSPLLHLLGCVVALVAGHGVLPARASPRTPEVRNIVLVHGAFADDSS